MSETNKALVRRLIEEGFNKGNVKLIDELVGDNFVYREPTLGEKRGPQGYKDVMNVYRTAFPDATITIDELIASGDVVVTRWTGRGTHRGSLMGIASTNKPVTVQGLTLTRVSNGKIVEEFECYDALGMLRQMGAIPTTVGKAA
jgi:steroid delta-isomerase-like uncharacterized protein